MTNPSQAAADAKCIALNRSKAENLSRALHAFDAAPRLKAQDVPATRSSNGIQSIMGGAMLSTLEPAPRATVRKADTLPIHPKVAPLKLPAEQAALLSFVVHQCFGRSSADCLSGQWQRRARVCPVPQAKELRPCLVSPGQSL